MLENENGVKPKNTNQGNVVNANDALYNIEPTLENTPKILKALTREFFEFKKLLQQKEIQKKEPVRWLNIDQVGQKIPGNPKRPTIYGWVHDKKIPYHKKNKALGFLESEIDEWLISGKVKTNSEIEAEAKHFLNRNSKR
jgi:predicted DNA-binding transcriptional regulator AlpA